MNEKFNKFLPIFLVVVGIIAVCGIFFPLQKRYTGVTPFTMNTNSGKFNDSADLYQNVQAVAERMASSTQYYILQADSKGIMQGVLPSSLTLSGLSLTGGTTLTGDTRAASFVQTGTLAAFTVTSTATAANVCDSPTWTFTAVTGTPAITLPVSTTLFADCLTTNGDMRLIHLVNASSATSTYLMAGGGGTLKNATSSYIGASEHAFLVISRDATLTYKASLLNAGL